MKAKLAAKRHARRSNKSDEWLVPTDYVAAVYGERAAIAHIDELELEDEDVRERLLARAKHLGRLGLSPESASDDGVGID